MVSSLWKEKSLFLKDLRDLLIVLDWFFVDFYFFFTHINVKLPSVEAF